MDLRQMWQWFITAERWGWILVSVLMGLVAIRLQLDSHRLRQLVDDQHQLISELRLELKKK